MNDEKRKEVLRKLLDYESDTCELIHQTNLALTEAVRKKNNKYESYESTISEIESWLGYQQILLNILYETENLRYTLDFGVMSSEFYYSAYNKHFKISSTTQYNILKWHINNVENFGIDLINKIRPRQWIFDRVPFIRKVLSSSVPVSDLMVEKMNSQGGTYFDNRTPRIPLDVYEHSVQLVKKDEKLYYLPMANNAAGGIS